VVVWKVTPCGADKNRCRLQQVEPQAGELLTGSLVLCAVFRVLQVGLIKRGNYSKSRTAVVGAMRGVQSWCRSAQKSPSMRLWAGAGFPEHRAHPYTPSGRQVAQCAGSGAGMPCDELCRKRRLNSDSRRCSLASRARRSRRRRTISTVLLVVRSRGRIHSVERCDGLSDGRLSCHRRLAPAPRRPRRLAAAPALGGRGRRGRR